MWSPTLPTCPGSLGQGGASLSCPQPEHCAWQPMSHTSTFVGATDSDPRASLILSSGSRAQPAGSKGAAVSPPTTGAAAVRRPGATCTGVLTRGCDFASSTFAQCHQHCQETFLSGIHCSAHAPHRVWAGPQCLHTLISSSAQRAQMPSHPLWLSSKRHMQNACMLGSLLYLRLRGKILGHPEPLTSLL